jgi:hypothetical protein
MNVGTQNTDEIATLKADAAQDAKGRWSFTECPTLKKFLVDHAISHLQSIFNNACVNYRLFAVMNDERFKGLGISPAMRAIIHKALGRKVRTRVLRAPSRSTALHRGFIAPSSPPPHRCYVDAQFELVFSTDALQVGVVNTPVDRACTDELVEFLTIIGQQWLTGPFTVNRVLDLETLRTLTTTDLMDMNISQHPCEFLFQKLAERDQARAGSRWVLASGQAMRCVSLVHISCVRLCRKAPSAPHWPPAPRSPLSHRSRGRRCNRHALDRVGCWHPVRPCDACLSCTFRACAFAGRRCRRFIGHWH